MPQAASPRLLLFSGILRSGVQEKLQCLKAKGSRGWFLARRGCRPQTQGLNPENYPISCFALKRATDPVDQPHALAIGCVITHYMPVMATSASPPLQGESAFRDVPRVKTLG